MLKVLIVEREQLFTASKVSCSQAFLEPKYALF